MKATIAAPLAPFEPSRGRTAEPLTLLDAIRRYGDLRAAEPVEAEHGSPAEADQYARQAATLLTAVEAALAGAIAGREHVQAAFDAETAKRLEHEQTIADQQAQLQRALAEDRERIARAIETKQGLRCPTCGGKASSVKPTGGYLVDRRCGGGHAWSAPAYRTLDFAAVVRAGGAA